MNYAPIVVSVYDRPNHFKACVESLAKNKGAEKTLLFISSDGPRDAISAEKVRAVRDYIKTIKGFKEVFAFCPEENTSGKIKRSVYERIKSDFPRYIRTEDDNVFSPYALKYFNEGLELFEDDPRIHAICGYMYPGFPSRDYKQVYLQCFAGWGAAFWRDKDIYPGFDEKKLAKEVLSQRALFNKVNSRLPHMAPMNKSIAEGKLTAGDVTRCNYIIYHNKICVFPSISLVRNIGNDGTGEHCNVNKIYENQKIADQEIKFHMAEQKEPLISDTRWLSRHFGKVFQTSIIHSHLIFFHNNANGLIKISLFFAIRFRAYYRNPKVVLKTPRKLQARLLRLRNKYKQRTEVNSKKCLHHYTKTKQRR